MLTISPHRYTPIFTAHMPKNFGSMMTYLHKNTPDVFECSNTVRVSTRLEDGTEVFGTVYFDNGKYRNLVMDDGFENRKQEFMKTALVRYRDRILSDKVKKKLEFEEK